MANTRFQYQGLAEPVVSGPGAPPPVAPSCDWLPRTDQPFNRTKSMIPALLALVLCTPILPLPTPAFGGTSSSASVTDTSRSRWSYQAYTEPLIPLDAPVADRPYNVQWQPSRVLTYPNTGPVLVEPVLPIPSPLPDTSFYQPRRIPRAFFDNTPILEPLPAQGLSSLPLVSEWQPSRILRTSPQDTSIWTQIVSVAPVFVPIPDVEPWVPSRQIRSPFDNISIQEPLPAIGLSRLDLVSVYQPSRKPAQICATDLAFVQLVGSTPTLTPLPDIEFYQPSRIVQRQSGSELFNSPFLSIPIPDTSSYLPGRKQSIVNLSSLSEPLSPLTFIPTGPLFVSEYQPSRVLKHPYHTPFFFYPVPILHIGVFVPMPSVPEYRPRRLENARWGSIYAQLGQNTTGALIILPNGVTPSLDIILVFNGGDDGYILNGGENIITGFILTGGDTPDMEYILSGGSEIEDIT